MSEAIELASPAAAARADATRTSHASVAERVTLFEDRAEVVRSAVVPVDRGAQWISLVGPTPFLDDRSLRATSSDVVVIGARMVRRVFEEPAGDEAEVERLELERRDAAKRLRLADEELSRAQVATTRVENLFARWLEALAEVPAGVGADGGADEWRRTYDALAEERAAARDSHARAAREKADAQEARRRAETRLAEARLLRPREETLVEVHLESGEAREARLELSYRTPCALWRPEHLARLAATSEGEGTVELVTFATAWQATGERWENVRVRFSTARPARPAAPPLLSTDLLSLRRKTDEERRTVVVEAREETVQVAGLDRGARVVEEMPGVDDGGEPLTFEPAERVTLVSDARPLRIEVARISLPARLDRVVVAERAAAPHLRATMTLAGGPLLAGPVRLARGAALVGLSRVSFVGRGEPFELGFGADDGVRVRREVVDERDTAVLTGTQTLARRVTLFVSNLSGQPRRLVVRERVPVSEIEGLEVATKSGGWKLDPNGFATQELDLPARGARTLELAYEVKAAKRISLPL